MWIEGKKPHRETERGREEGWEPRLEALREVERATTDTGEQKPSFFFGDTGLAVVVISPAILFLDLVRPWHTEVRRTVSVDRKDGQNRHKETMYGDKPPHSV